MRPSKKQWTSLTTVGIFLLFSCYGCGKTSTDESGDTSKNGNQQTTDASSAELTAAAAQQLIPEAASMSSADFEKVAGINPDPDTIENPQANPDAIENKSLTLILLTLNPMKESYQNEAVLEDFNYPTNNAIPEPGEIADVIYKSKSKGYATFLQPDLITHCTCNTEGETASGFVMFNAPDLYSGKVRFVARRNEGSWQIEEFHLPNYGIKTVLGNDGKWYQPSNETSVPPTTDSSGVSLEKLINSVVRKIVSKKRITRLLKSDADPTTPI